jgi:hypothetical protein
VKTPHEDHTIISWKAPEFFHYKKSQWWFPFLAVAILILTTIFILTSQYLVAIIVILGGATIYRLAHQEPEVLPVTFSTHGVSFKGKSLEFKNLKTFWITDHEEAHRLHLQSVERFSVPLVIPLVKEDVEKVRSFLKHYLPETHDVVEDLADRINRILKI